MVVTKIASRVAPARILARPVGTNRRARGYEAGISNGVDHMDKPLD